MDTKHTPGPWSLKDDISLVVGPSADPAGDPVATIEGHPEEAFANARLIAAAPDLLAALRALVEYEDDAPPDGSRGAEVYNQARAAIAKATNP